MVTSTGQRQLPRVRYDILVVGAVLGVACLWLPDVAHRGRALGPGALLPPLVAVVLTLATGRLVVSLASAALAGAVVLYGPLLAVPLGARHFVVDTLLDPTHLAIIGFATCLLTMVSVMSESGGTGAVVGLIRRYIASRRRTQVGGALMGCALFFDDYANCMIVGPALRPLFDRFGISRARLAFVVDATAAPIAGLVPLSTWVGYEIGLLDGALGGLGLDVSGFSMLLEMLPYRFYCVFALGLVFITAVTGREYGPMLAAEDKAFAARAARSREQAADASAASDTAEEAVVRGRPRDAFVPMTTVLVVVAVGFVFDGGGLGALTSEPSRVASLAFWRQTLSAAHHGAQVLLVASVVGLVLSIALPTVGGRISRDRLALALRSGLRVGLGATTVLLLAWALAAACSAVGTGPYLAGVLGGHLLGWMVPLVTFATAAGIAFATGTSWGTMAMLLPTALPLSHQLGEPWLMAVTAAAVLDGSIFGDHCSPISDTTLMSSIGAECDHLEHVRTQIPYATLAMLMALTAGYGATLLGLPAPACWGLGLLGLLVVVRLLGRRAGQAPGR